MPRLVSERIKKLREEIAEISEANRTHMRRRDGGEMEGQTPTKNGGSNDCRKFWMSLRPSLIGKSPEHPKAAVNF